MVADLHYDEDFKQVYKIYGILVEAENEYDSRFACFRPYNPEELKIINKEYLIELINSKGYFTIGHEAIQVSVRTQILSKYRF